MNRTRIPIAAAAAVVLAGCTASNRSTVAPTELLNMVGAEPAVADPTQYYPPQTFMGYPWGTHVDAIPDLKFVQPGGVALAVGYDGKVMDVQIQNCGPGENAGPCKIQQTVQGAGSFVMATYYRDWEPRHPYPGANVAAALYYFCARTAGASITPHVRKRLKLCGGDILFQSDAPAIWEEGDPPTDYEMIVNKLNETYGRHDGFKFTGQVTVTDDYGRRYTFPRERRYQPLTWCGKSQTSLYPVCESTITVHFDTEQGVGQVLYATSAMYQFAGALNELSEEKVPLFERLNGFRVDRYKSKRKTCTGTHLCGGTTRSLTDRELDVFRTTH